MFEKQAQHYLLLGILLAGVFFFARGDVLSGQLWGMATETWLWLAVAVPVLHQISVGLLWRAELYHHKMAEWFGDQAFDIFKIIFTTLFIGRPITLILLGISNMNTLMLDPGIAYVLAVILFVPFAYTMYSVFHYFGIDRAYGADHFDTSYRSKPFVKQGMFKYTDNAMYKFGFLILWVIALVLLSKAALLVAAFSHLYIWVHFYFTELPDIRHIYGTQPNQGSKEPA
ncbi:MAG TPA: methyltransferase [Anaerolineales bacterium]